MNLKTIQGILFFLWVFLVSIGTYGRNNDLKKNGLYGKVRTVKEITCQPALIDGQIADGRRVQWYQNTFNLLGNKSEDIKFKADSSVDKRYNYIYDETGRRIEMQLFSSDNVLITKIIYTYTPDGFLSSDQSYDINGNADKKIEYHFDDKGYVTLETIYNSGNNLKKKLSHVYDLSGNQTETLIFKSNGELEKHEIRLFDKYGNVTEEKTYDPAGKLIRTMNYSYFFEDSGNWIKKISFLDGKPNLITRREISYY